MKLAEHAQNVQILVQVTHRMKHALTVDVTLDTEPMLQPNRACCVNQALTRRFLTTYFAHRVLLGRTIPPMVLQFAFHAHLERSVLNGLQRALRVMLANTQQITYHVCLVQQGNIPQQGRLFALHVGRASSRLPRVLYRWPHASCVRLVPSRRVLA
jgi:hypothetical protein